MGFLVLGDRIPLAVFTYLYFLCVFVSQFVCSEWVNARGRANVAVCESELGGRKGVAVFNIGVFVKEGQSSGDIFSCWYSGRKQVSSSDCDRM